MGKKCRAYVLFTVLHDRQLPLHSLTQAMSFLPSDPVTQSFGGDWTPVIIGLEAIYRYDPSASVWDAAQLSRMMNTVVVKLV